MTFTTIDIGPSDKGCDNTDTGVWVLNSMPLCGKAQLTLLDGSEESCQRCGNIQVDESKHIKIDSFALSLLFMCGSVMFKALFLNVSIWYYSMSEYEYIIQVLISYYCKRKERVVLAHPYFRLFCLHSTAGFSFFHTDIVSVNPG